MYLKIPFYGLLANRSPMDGLIEHYDKISECIEVVSDSLECYVAGGVCREFEELTTTIDKIEDHADKIKRNIRNHLPRGLFMAVDKTLFLNYTKSQDNILDSAQDALHWLAMRKVSVGTEFQKDLIDLVEEVETATVHLGPALKATIALVNGSALDREGTKNSYRRVRQSRHSVRIIKNKITREVYNADLDFKDIYQLIHFVDCLDKMGHDAENCADILRSMIAR